MKRFCAVVLIIFIAGCVSSSKIIAQNDSVRVFGVAREYKGMVLSFETIQNYVTREKSLVKRFKVDASGNFDTYLHVAYLQKYFLDLGKLRASIYLEPGKTYQIVLPPYAPRNEADRFNPYFEPDEVTMGLVNTDKGNLNERISRFDEKFRNEFDSNAYDLFSKGDVKRADRIKFQLDSLFPSQPGSYFESHKNFRYARIYMLAMKRQKRAVINTFYSHKPIDFSMPAYWEAYSEIFKDFFRYYFSSTNGRLLKAAMSNKERFDALSLVMSADSLFKQSDFRESLLLSEIYGSYFNGQSSPDDVINLIEQATTTGGSPQICLFASQMLHRINRLRVGTPAPDFQAYKIDKTPITLDQYKGKFVYLNFVHTENYACKKDLQVLDGIGKVFKKDLKVVTVLLDNDAMKGFSFMNVNKYSWDVSHYGGDGKILLDYSINALPVYYLIDPDGNLVLSPAPPPEENFNNYFADVLQKYKNKQLKATPEKTKSIYDF